LPLYTRNVAIVEGCASKIGQSPLIDQVHAKQVVVVFIEIYNTDPFTNRPGYLCGQLIDYFLIGLTGSYQLLFNQVGNIIQDILLFIQLIEKHTLKVKLVSFISNYFQYIE